MTPDEIKQVLELHAASLGSREGARSANLTEADLMRYALLILWERPDDHMAIKGETPHDCLKNGKLSYSTASASGKSGRRFTETYVFGSTPAASWRALRWLAI